MHLVRTALAIAMLVATGAFTTASAQQKQPSAKSQRPHVITRDRSRFRAPRPPHRRTYVGPGPTIVPPMERIPLPAPLAQPPIR